MTDIGFIGAGQLGEPMVQRILGAGHGVLACARRPELRDRLKRRGAEVTDSVQYLAESSDIVISCLFSDDQLHRITAGPGGLIANARPSTIFASHTTGSIPSLEMLASAGLRVVDAPVSGTAEDIADGRLTVLVGGPSDAIDVVTPILASYANTIIRTGVLGSALTLKLVNNALFAANVELVVAAMHAVDELGGEGSRLLEVLQHCSGGSRASASIAAAVDVDTFGAAAGPFLKKDVAAYLSAIEQAGVRPSLLDLVVERGCWTD